MEDGKEVQELMVKKEIDPLSIVSHTFPLEEIPATFEKVIKVSDGMLKSVVVR
jgi:threonine dehydrogenase-like Zn-dependent dehydrogenase